MSLHDGVKLASVVFANDPNHLFIQDMSGLYRRNEIAQSKAEPMTVKHTQFYLTVKQIIFPMFPILQKHANPL